MDRIRLLNFLTNFNIGGTEKQVVQLLKSLDRESFDVRLACLGEKGPLLSTVRELAIPYSEYRISSFWNPKTVRQQLRFALDIRRSGVQIVHTYGFYTNVFAIPAAKLARTVSIIASIRDTGAYLTELQKRVQRIACRMADHVLVNAEAVRQWLIASGYRPDNIHVICNGIQVPPLPPPSTREAIRREFGIPLSAPVVAVHSRLSAVKGIEYLIDAAPEILRRFPETCFLIIGDGIFNYMDVLKSYAARKGVSERVIFTGFRLDIPAVLSAVDVSVSASLSEGLSNSLLESLAASLPVVATRVGGNPEIIEDGVSGILIPVRDHDAISRAVCRLLSNPRIAESMGAKGREKALSRFSASQSVRNTEQFYRRVLDGNKHHRVRLQHESTA
jgi:L-malate glycosyltransferase